MQDSAQLNVLQYVWVPLLRKITYKPTTLRPWLCGPYNFTASLSVSRFSIPFKLSVSLSSFTNLESISSLIIAYSISTNGNSHEFPLPQPHWRK
ncbi:hypothetical protein LENED_006065 [Lentinula edodes]|uniref:Uncharacterized protein n=1 Tax=Lentinula edodes TaxID=5353 RepID=A0A1Q3EB10_LENED|nr:hypothetical protein LENED_006065 [Lentinula edodes]